MRSPASPDVTACDIPLETYRQAHDPDSPVPADIAMTTDRVFRIPSLRIAEAHLRGSGTVIVYQFAWRSPAFEGRAGASHGMEGPFVFDDFSSPSRRRSPVQRFRRSSSQPRTEPGRPLLRQEILRHEAPSRPGLPTTRTPVLRWCSTPSPTWSTTQIP